MWFIKELELYKTVKPYRLDFEPEDEDFPRTNLERFQVPGVAVRDIRQHQDELDFATCGFAVLKMPFSLTTLDYDHQATVKQQFYPFVEEQVATFLEKFSSQQPKVIALDHKVRCNDHSCAQGLMMTLDNRLGRERPTFRYRMERTTLILNRCLSLMPVSHSFPDFVVIHCSHQPQTGLLILSRRNSGPFWATMKPSIS